MKKMLAMILAGGRGKRMGIMCQARPKPLLPFGGGYRVLDFTLSNCVHSHIDNVALVTDFERLQLAEYSNRWQSANNATTLVKTLEPSNGSYGGTADAIYENLGYIERNNAEAVVVLAGDHVYKMDYRAMLDFHEQTKADVTVAVTRVPIHQAHRFGIVSLNDGGEIVNFVEKPANPESNLVSMGIYLFNSAVLFDCLGKNYEPNRDFGYSIFPSLVKNYNVFAYEHRGYWQDIGTVEAYFAANMEFLHQELFPDMNGNWPILTETRWNEPAPGHSFNASVNSFIGPGCVVKGEVDNSILMQGVWVEDCASVRNSIVMPNVFVGYHSVVDRCIVDEGVHISRFSYIGFQGAQSGSLSDITIVGRDVIVPPYSALMRNSRVPACAVLTQHNGKREKSDALVSFSPIGV